LFFILAGALLAISSLTPTLAQTPEPSAPHSAKPTFIVDSNYPADGSMAVVHFREHLEELKQSLQTDCGLKLTIRIDKADYLVSSII
jgi:hypothetical protein